MAYKPHLDWGRSLAYSPFKMLHNIIIHNIFAVYYVLYIEVLSILRNYLFLSKREKAHATKRVGDIS